MKPLDLDHIAELADIADLYPHAIRELVDLARLGNAWVEVEAALPEGWQVAGLVRVMRGEGWAWQAMAHNRAAQLVEPSLAFGQAGAYGLTPVAALEALRDRLRDPA